MNKNFDSDELKIETVGGGGLNSTWDCNIGENIKHRLVIVGED